jgi:hypothetical protein
MDLVLCLHREHLLVVICVVTLFVRWPLSVELMATALIILLLAGITNVWDMTVTRSPSRHNLRG